MLSEVRFEGVHKIFGTETAVEDLNLTVNAGEFLVLVGPSGCGKTTTLRMLAGLERPSYGRILIGDKLVNNVSPRFRDVAMVFQSYALYPHMNVYDNLAFGMRARGASNDLVAQRGRETAEVLGLGHLLQRRPSTRRACSSRALSARRGWTSCRDGWRPPQARRRCRSWASRRRSGPARC